MGFSSNRRPIYRSGERTQARRSPDIKAGSLRIGLAIQGFGSAIHNFASTVGTLWTLGVFIC